LTEFVQAAAKRMARKRQELTDALDVQMFDLRVAVDQHYYTLALSNKTVTDNLRSIRRNDEVFEETLKMVKQDKDLPAAMRVVSDKLDKLMVK
jgi:carboxypeptidase C (cathepsin A)